MTRRILVVDDERDMRVLLQRIISQETVHEAVVEADPFKAIERLKTDSFDMVITDLKMPKMDGIQLLEEMKKIDPTVSVVVMTAYATVETAVEAIRKGAYDYISKPFRRQRIVLMIDKVMEWQQMVGENRALRKALADKNTLPTMIGTTPVMKDIYERIRQVAPTMATILITGDSGTGKELVARAIHENSLRYDKKFITVNCTAIPEHVMESELFGHVKGAFTDAWKDKKGLVEAAHKGTLFLDEIGDMKPSMQTKLLRLLQEGEYKPVGSEITRKADLRFVTATHHDLKADIEKKRFREDLYYRLNVIRIDLPPLKERREDIPLLSHHFLQKYARLNGKDISYITPTAQEALVTQPFPGNVRELENYIERGVIFCQGDALTLQDLSLDSDQASFFTDMENDIFQLAFKEAKEAMIHLFHRQYIRTLLAGSNGNISKAAEKAGIQRQYLHRLMKESGINARAYREDVT